MLKRDLSVFQCLALELCRNPFYAPSTDCHLKLKNKQAIPLDTMRYDILSPFLDSRMEPSLSSRPRPRSSYRTDASDVFNISF